MASTLRYCRPLDDVGGSVLREPRIFEVKMLAVYCRVRQRAVAAEFMRPADAAQKGAKSGWPMGVALGELS